MATIYDLATGRIISENKGITTIDRHAELPGYAAALQPARHESGETAHPAVAEYMALIQELLKKL